MAVIRTKSIPVRDSRWVCGYAHSSQTAKAAPLPNLLLAAERQQATYLWRGLQEPKPCSVQP